MQFLLKRIFINHMNSIFCQLYQIKTVYNPYNSFFSQKSPIADVSQGPSLLSYWNCINCIKSNLPWEKTFQRFTEELTFFMQSIVQN